MTYTENNIDGVHFKYRDGQEYTIVNEGKRHGVVYTDGYKKGTFVEYGVNRMVELLNDGRDWNPIDEPIKENNYAIY